MAKSEAFNMQEFWRNEEALWEFDDDVDEGCRQMESGDMMKVRHLSIEEKMATSSLKRKGNLKQEDLLSFASSENYLAYHKSERIEIHHLNWSPEMKRSMKNEFCSRSSKVGNDSSLVERVTITKDCKNIEWVEYKSAKSITPKNKNIKSKSRKVSKVKTSHSKPRNSKANRFSISNVISTDWIDKIRSKKCIEKYVELSRVKRDSTPQNCRIHQEDEEVHLVTMNEVEKYREN